MPEIVVPKPSELILDGLRLRKPRQTNRSIWTSASKKVALPGAEMWMGQVSVRDVATEVEERQWRAFLWNLAGADWFKVPLPCNQHTGSRPTVATGATAGYTLPLAGMTPSTTLLQAGQFITVPLPSGRFRAVALSAPLVTNGSGAGTAALSIALTETPTTGVTVETLNPFIAMSTADDELGFAWSEAISGFSIEVEEAR